MRRVVVVAAALCAALLSTACSAPPQKEIDRAQGAIDAARAAGADQYATEPFSAATAAMEQTHEAVKQRDYRLALSHAIDANERALEAAKQAANGKARARGEAEMSLSQTTTALRQLEVRLKAAEAVRLTSRETEPARSASESAARDLQEARAAVATGNYLEAAAASKAISEQITKATRALDEAIEARTAKAPRRRR